jgi:hypothetical protein
MSNPIDWFGCDYEHCGFEGTAQEIKDHIATRHNPESPKWDGYMRNHDE